jgi:hypothetical protein
MDPDGGSEAHGGWNFAVPDGRQQRLSVQSQKLRRFLHV